MVFVEFWGEMMHDRRLREVNAALYARIRRLVGRLVVEGVRAGCWRRVDPGQAAAVILGLLDGVALQMTFDPRVFDVATATGVCEDAIDRYLTTGGGRRRR